ncbi:uncharacterized protein LOC118648345 [Monomorium pharaonis]|uniref:uncharacterized protein LOC118648345 n=1 Tax=Monomorium pharaonis TaxID=307658 RepID=UPI001746A1A5|nr:uncharacterized protein LOC118648345 [Monomorium pharaonis]
MPLEIILTNWKLTAEYRRKSIKSNRDLKLNQIFENWPILKHPNAYTLIEEDYSSLNLSTLELTLESWKTFFAKILTVRPPKKDDDNAQILMDLIQCDELTDSRKLLSHLLPPKGRIRLKKDQWKPSIPECKDSIIISITLIADITKVQEQKRKKAADLGITLQPFIIAVGPSNDISDIFISVDDTLYKVPSALKAIDLCYKIFQVFDVEYPIESAHIWLLFQRVLYNYENSLDKMTPNITEIISDMTFHKDT